MSSPARSVAALAALLLACPLWRAHSASCPAPVPAHLKDYAELYARDPRAASLQWFRDARFGMMVSYGLCSLDARHCFEQWHYKIPVTEYARKAERFTADGFDAEAIAALAQRTGMRYITFIVKFCDGFCFWNTQQTEFNSVRSAARRDLLREMAAACRHHGLGLFIFYEHGFEWRHPHAPRTRDWKIPLAEVPYPSPEPAYAHGADYDMDNYVDFVSAQMTELLTDYGPVAGVWLDGYAVPKSGDSSKFRLQELYALIRRLQPHALVSYKWGITGTEDFLAPEISWIAKEAEQLGDEVDTRETSPRLKEAEKRGVPVEVCDTLMPRWFFITNDKLREAPYAVNNFRLARSLRINYLLNIALLPDGSINPREAAILDTVAAEAGRNGWLRE